jgi:hypothetical protein
MPFNRIRVIDTGSISAGGYVDFSQAEEVNLTLKKVFIIEATGATMNNVVLTLNLGDTPFFRPNASAALFHPSNPSVIELNLPVAAGVKVNGRVTNNESAARRLFIHLVYETA